MTKRTFVDRGGTFTDVVVVHEDGRMDISKLPSDRAVVGELAQGQLTFGTTVATNALLERRGVRTLLIVTQGFADLPSIGDQARPDLFDSDKTWPEPLSTFVVEIGGRLDDQGQEIEPLDLGEIPHLEEVDAVAIALINSHRNPQHELVVAKEIHSRHKHLFLSLGHQRSPELGYLARIETTLVDAAITPILDQALIKDKISENALAMRSDGGLCPALSLRAPDAVLSGPAGGVLAVAAVAAQAGFDRAVGLDMGGTSTDVCRVEVGRLPRRQGETRIAGARLRTPMFDIETIAAGGGSILRHDGIRLSVGPDSAGADPGPACYGRGGPPTLTDAALVNGLIDASAFDPPLDPAAITLPGQAVEFLAIARDAMAQAIRRVATERGVDLADHALVSYGGAAGQHGAEVAERLGIKTVIVHPCASVLSAWGQSLARREESAVASIWQTLPDAWPAVEKTWQKLIDELPDLGEIKRSIDLRHQGTEHNIQIQVEPGESVKEVLNRFDQEHRRRFGFDRPNQTIEVVNGRVRVLAPLQQIARADSDPWKIGDGTVAGPKLLPTPTTSVWVPEGWEACRKKGLLFLQQKNPNLAAENNAKQRSAYGIELWGNRFMAVATDAGEVLRRLARSVNIRERLDFSCAVFDGQGRLVANAPHMPVHLGAMGETVRDLIRCNPNGDRAQAWLSNDPVAGGSHLPDLTVVTPVKSGDRLWYVANRGHHVDVGGKTPGSMPPHSQSLKDEGFVMRHLPLLKDGHLADIRQHLKGCRQMATVLADLEAQVAANAHPAQLLKNLGPPDLVETWMGHLHDAAEEAVGEVIKKLKPARAEEKIAGISIRLSLDVKGDRLIVDLTGTGGPDPGNLNAPPAVVRAAVLFSLRVLVGKSIPLNEGALNRVEIICPSPSLVSPPAEAAVVGGNVETSQRLVDLFLQAAGYRAGSQGTMNNLTLGGDQWSLYETIGGGLGATAHGPGVSGRQVHMTNTRSTDVEVIEQTLPLRVRKISYRPNSGGAGVHRGGDGLIREIEATENLTVALLATRRDHGAPGLAGGDPGLPGKDQLFVNGQWQDWDRQPTTLGPGDRVRIATPGGGGWGSLKE